MSLKDPYADALFDPILEEYILPLKTLMELKALEKNIAEGQVAPLEHLLKRTKIDSLLSSPGATYDPVLQEYVLPNTTMMELKALKEDMIKKRNIFHEFQCRKENNLQNYELFCDPLVHTYRMRDLLFKGNTGTPVDAFKATQSKAVLSKYRKLNAGDDLVKATMGNHYTLMASSE